MATVTIEYGSAVEIDIDPESLATSSTRTAGVESAVIDNTTDKFIDVLVGGKITCGTTPTASLIEVWVYAAVNDTPDYPDTIDGTKSAETITSENVKNSAMRLGAVIFNDTTSDRTYWVAPFSVANLFGFMPHKWGIFVTHSTVAALNATATNHRFWYKPAKFGIN